MSWEHHHSASEILASAAEALSRLGQKRRAKDLYRFAAEEESRALRAVEPSKTRTIGVTAVSAVALYYKADEFASAKSLARQWFDSSSLPSFAREQIEEIIRVIGPEPVRPTQAPVNVWDLLNHKAATLLRLTGSTTAILYASVSGFGLVRGLTARSATGLDVGWGMPDSYQFVVALCLVAAAIALLFLRNVANLVAVLMFGGVIITFYRWAIFTNGIKTNLGLAVIPQTNTISNHFFGAGFLDVLTLTISVGFLALSLWLQWTKRRTRHQSFGINPLS